ncbi:MAG: hypothetical protein IPI35_19750 [Deltaproteobacteria bacterium]|nr:hypothetical protein [Deltaproteobacteria bacterium]
MAPRSSQRPARSTTRRYALPDLSAFAVAITAQSSEAEPSAATYQPGPWGPVALALAPRRHAARVRAGTSTKGPPPKPKITPASGSTTVGVKSWGKAPREVVGSRGAPPRQAHSVSSRLKLAPPGRTAGSR